MHVALETVANPDVPLSSDGGGTFVPDVLEAVRDVETLSRSLRCGARGLVHLPAPLQMETNMAQSLDAPLADLLHVRLLAKHAH